MENLLVEKKEVSIFKTSADNQEKILLLRQALDLIVGHELWNFDLEDKDNILRIEANTCLNGFLIQEIKKLGFECEELF